MSSQTATDSAHLKTLDSAGRRLAGIYAEAFLAAAENTGKSAEATTELRELVGALGGADSELNGFLASPTQSRESKAKVIQSLAKVGASEILVDFLQVLNDHDRVGLLPAIADLVDQILLARTGKVKVFVTSATPLDESTSGNLAECLRAKLGKNPVFQNNVNPEILGGLVIQVGDWVWDGSLAKQLTGLRDQLFERGNHAIQGGRDRFRSDR